MGGGTLRSPPGSLSPPTQGLGTGRSEARGIRGEPDPSCPSGSAPVPPAVPTPTRGEPPGALLGGSLGSATPSPASPGGAARGAGRPGVGWGVGGGPEQEAGCQGAAGLWTRA